MPGTLYLVATPIGNLRDISHRALDTLQHVDLIACEDTRQTAKLLNAYKISKKLVSCHGHNENARSEELIGRLLKGDSIALVSDAGTPAISDPGFRLVKRSREAGIEIIPIPGPVAFVNAVIVSGLPTDQIFFGGFLPSKKGERRKYLASVVNVPATLVFYESPHRLGRSLTDCADVLGGREAAVVRELTKIYEEVISGTLRDLADRLAAANTKGEIVLVIGQAPEAEQSEYSYRSVSDRVRSLESEGLDRKSAMKQAAKEFGISRSEVYRQFVNESK